MTTRILHILSGDLWGGSEAQMALQIQALRSLGCEAEALLFNEGDTASNFRERKIPVTISFESRGFPALVRECKALMRTSPPQIVVTHGYKELCVAFLSAPRAAVLVHTTHGLTESYTGFRAIKSALYRGIEKLICHFRVAHRIVVTNEMRRELELTEHTSVVRCVGENRPAGEPPALLRPAVVAVGRLTRVKRFDRAIQWIAELNRTRRAGEKIHLALVGSGELESELKTLAQSLGCSAEVHFCGFRKDAAAYIATADTLLISSESEGLPTVLVEALLAGTPVCTTNLAGVREALELFPGYPAKVIPNEDRGESSILEALQLPRAAPSLLAPIREYFSPMRAAKEHLALYETLLQKAHQPR